jgi:preprotein translocase subunit SecG
VRITALGVLVVIAVGVVVYVLWQRGNQNPPDQPNENTQW